MWGKVEKSLIIKIQAVVDFQNIFIVETKNI